MHKNKKANSHDYKRGIRKALDLFEYKTLLFILFITKLLYP